MARTVSVYELLNTKFNELPFDGEWESSLGRPERRGSILVYGLPKNGKTRYALKLCKYLTKFGLVDYNSVEEGRSLSFQRAVKEENMLECSRKFRVVDKATVPEMIERLKKAKSAKFVIWDTVQFAAITFAEYKQLKELFPDKLFIFISHVDGNQPDGSVAKRIKRDADIFVFVEGFVAYPTGRHGGGKPFVIWAEKAAEYGYNQIN